MDTIRAEESVLIREVSSFEGLKELFLGKEKVSLLERCPHFRGVPREGSTVTFTWIEKHSNVFFHHVW